jgi:hypothetical protein
MDADLRIDGTALSWLNSQWSRRTYSMHTLPAPPQATDSSKKGIWLQTSLAAIKMAETVLRSRKLTGPCSSGRRTKVRQSNCVAYDNLVSDGPRHPTPYEDIREFWKQALGEGARRLAYGVGMMALHAEPCMS